MRKHSPPSKRAMNALALSPAAAGATGGGGFSLGAREVGWDGRVSSRATVCGVRAEGATGAAFWLTETGAAA